MRDLKFELVERLKKVSKRSTKLVLMNMYIVSSSILEISLRYNNFCQGTSSNWIWEYPNCNSLATREARSNFKCRVAIVYISVE